MAELAILRANVVFPVADSFHFERGAKNIAGMFDLEGPVAGCFTR
jgi:hypothetical protein